MPPAACAPADTAIRYHGRMVTMHSWRGVLARSNRTVQIWLTEWWRLAHLGALLLLLAMSPSSYKRSDRVVMARHIYDNTAPILTGFSVLCALLSLGPGFGCKAGFLCLGCYRQHNQRRTEK